MFQSYPLSYRPFAEIIEIAEKRIAGTERIFEDTAIYDAYESLEGEEKEKITTYAKRLVGYVCKELPITQFDFYDALEVLAKLGIFIVLTDRGKIT